MQKPASARVSTTKLFPPLLIAGFLIGGCGDGSATASPQFILPGASAAGPQAGGGSAPAEPDDDAAGATEPGADQPGADQPGKGRLGPNRSDPGGSAADRSDADRSTRKSGTSTKKQTGKGTTKRGTAGGTGSAEDSGSADSEAPAEARAPAPSRLPAELVGRWQGGAGDAFWYTFTRSGRLTMENRREGFSTPGVAVLDGDSITLYQDNGKVLTSARTWRIESMEVFGEPIHMLYLDDETYAKDEYFQS